MTMSRTQMKLALGLLVLLLLANLIYYYFSDWGLITVKVRNVPVGDVIKSIERQGWVTIYSNVDPTTKISMYVDHVPLPEALESLAVNSDAQWHLGFFVASDSEKVKAEIHNFTAGTDDSSKTFNFTTPVTMLASDDDDDDSASNNSSAPSGMPVPDPRKEVWPGVKAPPAPDPAVANANGAGGAPAGGPPAGGPGGGGPGGGGGFGGFGQQQPYTPPTSVQGYLRAFAMEADVWIMSPTDWDPPVPTAPAASSSITSAISRFVSAMHGSVTEAFVLRARPQRIAGGGGRGGRGGFGGGMDFSMMQDRMDNAINGLPAAYQPAAREQLKKEVAFTKEVREMPQDQRFKAMGQHIMNQRMAGMMRASPEKRAQFFARMVSVKASATGK